MMTSSDPVRRRPLEYNALQAFRLFAREHGYANEMKAIDRQLEERGELPHSIVIVGQVSSGKSSIVNALLEQPGLSPAGPAETTGTYLNFVPPSPGLQVGRAAIELTDGTWRPIDTDQLPEWVLIGSPSSNTGDAIPLGAVVAAQSPHLPGITIVDTPGTGGLDPAHARLALARAARATVLVLVTDAGSRLTKDELELLGECALHVEAVVILMNQIDLHHGWREVADENRVVLARASPRFAEISVVGMSAHDALKALARPVGDSRDRWRERSGINGVLDAVREHLAIADRLPTIHAIRRYLGIVRAVNQSLTATLDATLAGETGHEYAKGLASRQKRLEGDRKTWRRYLNRDFQRLRGDIVDEVTVRTSAFAEEWERRLSSKRFGISKDVHAQLAQEMAAQSLVVGQDVSNFIATRVAAVVSELFTSRGLRDLSDELMQDSAYLRKVREHVTATRDPSIPLDLTVGMSGYVGANLGMTIFNGVVGAGAATLFSPIALIGGVAMIGATLLNRNAQERVREAKARAREIANFLSTQLIRIYDSYVTEYTPEVEFAFDEELDRTFKELRSNAKLAVDAATASEEQRDDGVADIRHRHADIVRVLDLGEAAIARLRTAPEHSGVPGHPITDIPKGGIR